MSAIKSNCSENISDRDELTNTEQRKNDGATEQQINTVTENRNRGKKNHLRKPKSWSHCSKDKNVKHFQTKNKTSGKFLVSLLLTQTNI